MADITFAEKLVSLYKEKYEELKHVGSTFICFENKHGNILTIRKSLVFEKEFEELINIFNNGNYCKDIKIDLNKIRASFRFGYYVLNNNDKIIITKGHIVSKFRPSVNLRDLGIYFFEKFYEIDNSELIKLRIINKKNPELNLPHSLSGFNTIKMLLEIYDKNNYVEKFNYLMSLNKINHTLYNVYYDESTEEIYGIYKDKILNNIIFSSLKHLKSCNSHVLNLVKNKVRDQDKNSELITKSSILTRKWYFKNHILPELTANKKYKGINLNDTFKNGIINILENLISSIKCVIKLSQNKDIKTELITKSSILTRKWYFKNQVLPELLNKNKKYYTDNEIYNHCLKYENIIKLINLLDLEEFIKLCVQDNINDEDIDKFKYIYSMDKEIKNILIDF